METGRESGEEEDDETLDEEEEELVLPPPPPPQARAQARQEGARARIALMQQLAVERGEQMEIPPPQEHPLEVDLD
jgi:hypothetical protein